MSYGTIVVHDRMQTGYRYELSALPGEQFAPDFLPELTPAEMLELGVFGGKYMTDCQDEFPAVWFVRARLSPVRADPRVNCFGVLASQPLAEWRQNGWIYAEDPRGWFQWYCRYYQGRRCPDDSRQIQRWKGMTRHLAQLRHACLPGDLDCRPRQRQALLQWAYDTRLV